RYRFLARALEAALGELAKEPLVPPPVRPPAPEVLAVVAAPLVTVLALEVGAELVLGPDTMPPTTFVPRTRVIAPTAPMTDPGSVAVLPVSMLNTVVDE